MIAFRDATAARLGMELVVHVNEDGLKRGINPVASGSTLHTQVMKTEALRQALDKWSSTPPSAARAATRRRAAPRSACSRIRSAATPGTRATSARNSGICSTRRIKPGESMRVFPLSNWTELDIWEYIRAEKIPVVPLYFAKARPVVERDGMLIMVDDERLPLRPAKNRALMRVRFRTLGCYPLTGAVASEADTLDAVIVRCAARQLRAAGPRDRPRRKRLNGKEEARGIFLMDALTPRASRSARPRASGDPEAMCECRIRTRSWMPACAGTSGSRRARRQRVHQKYPSRFFFSIEPASS